MHLFIFGDQTLDVQPYLKDLSRHRDNPALEDFLTGAYRALRAEIDRLHHDTRNKLPRLTCIEDMLFGASNNGNCLALDMATTCLYQIGAFISRYSDHLDTTNNGVAGLCTGALTAAAVSCSRSSLGLARLGVSAVIAAFRIGLLADDLAQRLQPNSTKLSWLLSASGVEPAKKALNDFCDRHPLPGLRRPYISAYTLNAVMISGPPAILQELSNSTEFKDLRPQTAPINGPYHAPHLYSTDDVDEIIEGLAGKAKDFKIFHELLLASETVGTESSDFVSALKAAVAQILLCELSWPQIIRNIQHQFQRTSSNVLDVTTIGVVSEQFILKTLKQTSLGEHVRARSTPPKQLLNEDTESGRDGHQKLAIVGMAGRFPSSDNHEAFWDLLLAGLDVHKEPDARLHWDVGSHVDPAGNRKNTSQTSYGCWLDHPDLFDARFFNISPREAPQIDPAQRLALMTAYEAIEQAGLIPDGTPSTRRDRVGVFYGSTANDWMETNSSQDIDTYFIPGGNRAFIPGRINYHFGFSGPSYCVDTACSSSLASIHLACNGLWRGDIDTAIAGGSNVLTNPDFTAGLDRGRFLSRTGNCKTFDDSADGYCRGEGVGTVIIKRLDDAMADKDPILGVILSASTNHSAEAVSITRPHVGAQREILQNILNRGHTHPHDVSYVEMHGTGTQAGDASEMSSVIETFAPSTQPGRLTRKQDQPLYLGSAKANIGHGEAASGVTSLIKVLLMLQKNTIVPHCGIKTKINHNFPTDFAARNAHIASEPTSWQMDLKSSKSRKVVVNNFSAAGGNSALLIEDAPRRSIDPKNTTDPRSHHLVAISAKNAVSVQNNLRALLDHLGRTQVSLPSLSYTTSARRTHHPHRVMVTGATVQDVKKQLQNELDKNAGANRPKGSPNILFAFTGQGAHYPGMGKELVDNYSIVSKEFRRLDRLGQSMGFASAQLALDANDETFGEIGPVAIQLAGVYLQLALCKLWASWGITPNAVVGHSLGEYSAMAAAGILSDIDAIYLVGRRAQLVQNLIESGTHSMLVIKGSVDEVATALEGKDYGIACANSPSETVIAGAIDELQPLREHLNKAGFKCTPLRVPYAFHAAQMDPVLEPLASLAKEITFSESNLPYLSPLEGRILQVDEAISADYLVRHTRNTVNMQQALVAAGKEGIINEQTVTIEIGTHPAILPMVKANNGAQRTCFASVARGRSTFQVLAESVKGLYLKGADIRWSEYHHDFPAAHEVIPLPAYSWDLKPYWIEYVNDWSLRKGDPPLVTEKMPDLESTTIHRIVEETNDNSKTHIVVEANIARKDLSPLVQGHEVDGIPLCTPSVYGDISLTLGRYLQQQYRKTSEAILDVTDMEIFKALILRDGATEQLLQAHAEADWANNSVSMSFKSFDARGGLQEHARCILRYQDTTILGRLQAGAKDTLSKVQELQKGVVTGESARFNRPMVYRAIRPLARFHDDYRAIDEIFLSSKTLEASSRLSFGTVKKEGTYHTHPAVIDALTQACGFTMNCNDASDLDNEVFMNHGWGSFQIFEPLDMSKTYVTYTRMTESPDKLWRGDNVILDGDKVVAFFGQIAIQQVPRRVLRTILSIEAGNKGAKAQPNTTRPAKQAPKDSKPVPAPTGHTASVNKPESQNQFKKALAIIADESGLALTDLGDDTAFADVGIDSLMSLTISARIKDDLDIDFDMSLLVTECPTVGALKSCMASSDSEGESSGSELPSTGHNTPPTPITPPSDSGGTLSSKINLRRPLEIISEESGLAVEELTDNTEFADAGVDSLLSLVIVSRLRDELELDLQQDALLNDDCRTVGGLKRYLSGGEETKSEPEPEKESLVQAPIQSNASPPEKKRDSELYARQKAVDKYVAKYTAGFGEEIASKNPPQPLGTGTVVLVTGASGSLGGHLVNDLAQCDDVESVICLNRPKANTDPYARQQKAMRDKGIRTFDQIRPKLTVLQTETWKPFLGLTEDQYSELVSSVTHIIHNAWPMSAKRELKGFEDQFQVMRNLLDFADSASSLRPKGFRLSFTQVSSIGVVGHYGVEKSFDEHSPVVVPETRAQVDYLLPNGYSEAKWGCERMLEETLHKYRSDRFRARTVRLGQIAGSKRCGYWSPTEHFAFLVKSSQTLKALPDVPGKLYWTPVEDVAGTLIDLSLSETELHRIYHIDNPVGQEWSSMNKILADALNISDLVPFEQWVKRVRAAPARDNPAATLAEFLDSNYLRMSCGGLVLDVSNTLSHSKTLASVGSITEEVARRYVHVWREIGFLK